MYTPEEFAVIRALLDAHITYPGNTKDISDAPLISLVERVETGKLGEYELIGLKVILEDAADTLHNLPDDAREAIHSALQRTIKMLEEYGVYLS